MYPDQMNAQIIIIITICHMLRNLIWLFLTWQPDYIIITINIAVIITAGRLFALTGFGFDYELQNTVFQKMCSETKSSEKGLKKNFGIMKYSSHHQNRHNIIRYGYKNLANLHSDKKDWPSCVKFVLICLPKVHLGRGSNNRD